MADPISIGISSLSLLTSGVIAWFTLLRKGTVRMTQPTMIYLGPDGPGGQPKVFLRTLLYATAKRGRIIENMYVKVRCGEIAQNFSFWVCGEDRLFRGSGLFVGSEGVARNHHFALPKEVSFNFFAERYAIKVYATLVGDRSPVLLHRVRLTLATEDAQRMRQPGMGAMFNWGPDTERYHASVDTRSAKPAERSGPDLFDALLAGILPSGGSAESPTAERR